MSEINTEHETVRFEKLSDTEWNALYAGDLYLGQVSKDWRSGIYVFLSADEQVFGTRMLLDVAAFLGQLNEVKK